MKNLDDFREFTFLDEIIEWSSVLLPAILCVYMVTQNPKPSIKEQSPVVEIKRAVTADYGFDFDKNGSLDTAITWMGAGRDSCANLGIPKDHKLFRELQ